MTPNVPWWSSLPVGMRRTLWALTLVPPLLLIPGVALFVWWMGTNSPWGLPAFLAWFAAEWAVVVGLAARLHRQGKALAPPRRRSAEERRGDIRAALRFGATLFVFLAVYLAAIYAVVFGLWPLHESSEAGAIALNVILLVVMVGVPIVFYLAARALGLTQYGSGGSGDGASRPR